MTEIRAGLTTFATMAYIIAVNVRVIHDIGRGSLANHWQASILSDTGGTCLCQRASEAGVGCANKLEFEACRNSESFYVAIYSTFPADRNP